MSPDSGVPALSAYWQKFHQFYVESNRLHSLKDAEMPRILHAHQTENVPCLLAIGVSRSKR